MTDRELLELAAKAAGIELRFLSTGRGPVPFSDGPGRIGEWNPLTDDGDALRLAVKLGLEVWNTVNDSRAMDDFMLGVPIKEPHGQDPCAATRRAIVRAAAEIGKGAP